MAKGASVGLIYNKIANNRIYLEATPVNIILKPLPFVVIFDGTEVFVRLVPENRPQGFA